jgi:hypothetical protein
MLGHTTLAMTNHYVQAVEGMQVIRSDRVSVVDARDLNIERLKRAIRAVVGEQVSGNAQVWRTGNADWGREVLPAPHWIV